jgi:hypothetical protein
LDVDFKKVVKMLQTLKLIIKTNIEPSIFLMSS